MSDKQSPDPSPRDEAFHLKGELINKQVLLNRAIYILRVIAQYEHHTEDPRSADDPRQVAADWLQRNGYK